MAGPGRGGVPGGREPGAGAGGGTRSRRLAQRHGGWGGGACHNVTRCVAPALPVTLTTLSDANVTGISRPAQPVTLTTLSDANVTASRTAVERVTLIQARGGLQPSYLATATAILFWIGCAALGSIEFIRKANASM